MEGGPNYVGPHTIQLGGDEERLGYGTTRPGFGQKVGAGLLAGLLGALNPEAGQAAWQRWGKPREFRYNPMDRPVESDQDGMFGGMARGGMMGGYQPTMRRY